MGTGVGGGGGGVRCVSCLLVGLVVHYNNINFAAVAVQYRYNSQITQLGHSRPRCEILLAKIG